MDAMEMRRNAIAELVNKHGTVSFSQIKEQFPNVSEMTLRTDLKALDAAKEIVRIHGGAKSVQLVIGTDDYLTRRSDVGNGVIVAQLTQQPQQCAFVITVRCTQDTGK